MSLPLCDFKENVDVSGPVSYLPLLGGGFEPMEFMVFSFIISSQRVESAVPSGAAALKRETMSPSQELEC
jgi:hypothetical protein